MAPLWSLSLLLVVCVVGTGAISFQLPALSHKCLQEDVHKDVLVVGNYEISSSDYSIINLDVSVIKQDVYASFFFSIIIISFLSLSPSPLILYFYFCVSPTLFEKYMPSSPILKFLSLLVYCSPF